MKEGMLKGLLLGKLDGFMAHDKDGFVDKMEEYLEDVDVERQEIQEAVDDLIETGWIEHNEKGDNISAKAPHVKVKRGEEDGQDN